MAKGLNNKLAGQMAEHLVCAELGRRGFLASPFSGNVPEIDIVVVDEYYNAITLQVKATRTNNWPSSAQDWMVMEFDEKTQCQKYIQPKELANPDLIYVLVVLGDIAKDTKDRYFILKKQDLQRIHVDQYPVFLKKHDGRRPRNPKSYDTRIRMNQILDFENMWRVITDRFEELKIEKTIHKSC